MEDHEVSVSALLWLKLELSSGHILTMNEEAGPIEEGNCLWIRCGTGRLKVSPEGANSVVIEAINF